MFLKKLAKAIPGVNWSAPLALAQTGWGYSTIRHAVVAGDTLVVVGSTGRVATTTDRNTWTYKPALLDGGAITSAVAVVWTGTTLTVFSSNGYLATSTDMGTTWTTRMELQALTTANSFFSITGAIWDGTQYVVTGTSGRIVVSSNGTDWTLRDGLRITGWGTSTAVRTIVKTPTKYLVAGTQGKIATSTDTVLWTYEPQLATTGFGATSVVDTIWTGTEFAVLSQQGKFATSTDGSTWTYSPGLVGLLTNAYSIARVGDKYIVGGLFVVYDPLELPTVGMATSSDGGVTWASTPNTQKAAMNYMTKYLTEDRGALVVYKAVPDGNRTWFLGSYGCTLTT